MSSVPKKADKLNISLSLSCKDDAKAVWTIDKTIMMESHEGSFYNSSVEHAKIDLAQPISNSDLLHGTVHHPTKFQANSWNP